MMGVRVCVCVRNGGDVGKKKRRERENREREGCVNRPWGREGKGGENYKEHRETKSQQATITVFKQSCRSSNACTYHQQTETVCTHDQPDE